MSHQGLPAQSDLHVSSRFSVWLVQFHNLVFRMRRMGWMLVFRCNRTDLHGTHHSTFSVVQNVAVKHPFSRTLVETHQEARSSPSGY